jgi:hypothetical protein
VESISTPSMSKRSALQLISITPHDNKLEIIPC